ncbi:hypothetical protein SDJN02_11308 [Cucurbita argyrosperma subsp. argyrosperma]|uniref:Uncharacterized protein LOC111463377 n=1 Tax=Cucurbita moschata TaxID=3662 RepID=A0A6J1HGY5_CUCMO|nr:uncharacterized protein LOC111463377 [Cucurbita moschata]KAG7027296.1 hypothetical protein SDJN02_11308 [Cucurbita argyrosperma subsp. argyrosperma]
MSALGLLRKALRSHFVTPSARANHGLPVFFRQSPRFFSTEGEQPPLESPADPFLDTSKTAGLVYGKLSGITRNTLKTDIVNLLEGCNLNLDDVKVEYNRSFTPTSMMMQFPSRQAYDNAFRVIGRKGRLYRLERADRSQWDILSPYSGKTVLLQGIPRNALVEDVERFLLGCDYDATSINMFFRASFPEPMRLATVLFPSPTQAMHAFLTKNRGFCLNNQILMRVLQ